MFWYIYQFIKTIFSVSSVLSTSVHTLLQTGIHAGIIQGMIRCFRKSIVAVSVIAAVALALDIYIIFIKDFALWWTRPFTSLMIALIGIFAARVTGSLIASAENTKLLNILYSEMDPGRFTACYAPVTEKVRRGSFDSFSSKAYLADGYSAGGEPKKALEIIDKAYEETSDKAKIFPFYRTNRTRYLIAAGCYEEAEEEIGTLLSGIDGKNAALKANIEKNILPLREFLDAFLHGNTDCTSLESDMEYSRVLTTKLEAARLVRILRQKEGKSTKQADRILSEYPLFKA